MARSWQRVAPLVKPADPSRIPLLVAHRGDVENFSENTVPAIRAALQAGARFVEFDVQLTADEVPVLLHDSSLARTAGLDLCIHDARLDELGGIELPTLSEVVALLQEWPGITAFVEIKPASVRRFGANRAATVIVQALQPVAERAVVISFHRGVLEHARGLGAGAIGWVLEEWGENTRRDALALQPEYLLCKVDRLPADDSALWEGPWRWVIYEVQSAELALRLASRGADFVETMAITRLLPALAQAR